MAGTVIAPGARVLIRDAEWIVRRVDRTGTGGQSIQVVGASEIVRNREARFLSEIEGKGITVLDPAETELVSDPSPQFRNSRLYLESLLRQSPPTGNDLWIGHRAAIDDLPYQLEPALQALEQPPLSGGDAWTEFFDVGGTDPLSLFQPLAPLVHLLPAGG